jgi:hypothetical protein
MRLTNGQANPWMQHGGWPGPANQQTLRNRQTVASQRRGLDVWTRSLYYHNMDGNWEALARRRRASRASDSADMGHVMNC